MTYVDAWYFWRKELEIDLSGFKKEEVKAELKDGYLTVSAVKDLDEDEKDKETGKYIRRERYHQYWIFYTEILTVWLVLYKNHVCYNKVRKCRFYDKLQRGEKV